ncbi:MAG: hypothetical protein ACI85I_001448, partial [Arenicella sp.]
RVGNVGINKIFLPNFNLKSQNTATKKSPLQTE